MFCCLFSKQSKRGLTLVETLVGTFLILVVFLGIFGAYQMALTIIALSKNQILSTAIANQELEQIRNLPYDLIGIEGQFPEGVLEAEKNIFRAGVEFKVETRVDYIVDPIDGLASPEDECPNDYKKAEIKVSWLKPFPSQIKISTEIAPKNLAQECAEKGGILSISVFDAYGEMISFSLIEIKDPITGQTLKTATPSEGKHYFSLEPSSYKVIISKPNYSSERTYGIDEIVNPVSPHPLLLEGELTENSFSIDRLSSLTVESRGPQSIGYPVVPNLSFNLRGEKIIGTDSEEEPVYKYSQDHLTDGEGQTAIFALEWDNYYFSVISFGLSLIGIESPPGNEITQPFGLIPESNETVRLILKAENSLLVKVHNSLDGKPIFSASVRLSNSELGYDSTQYTDENGQTYFIPLQSAEYGIEVQGPGYLGFSGTVFVSGDVIRTINLEQIE